MAKHIKVIITLLFALVLISCKKKENNPSQNGPPPPVSVDVIVVEKQKYSNEIEANGSILAKEYTELHPEVSGRLTFLQVSEGNNVSEGTVIARINNADLVAQLNGTKSQLNVAVKTEERMAQLLSINGVNQSDYDAAINQVSSLKSTIAYTEALIEKTIIRAPFSGTIGLRLVSPGAYVTPTTIITTLQQLSELKIDFSVPEAYSQLVKKGDEVEIVTSDNSSVRKKATVVAIEPMVSADSRNLTVRAILKNFKASPGSFVKVYIKGGIERKSILVPTNAVIPEDKNKMVVVVKGGKATFVKVQTGIRQTSGLEINSGLEVGDTVVVNGILFLRPDAVVKIKSVKNLQDLIQ